MMTTSGEAAFAAIEAGAVQRLAEFARLLDIVEGRRPTSSTNDDAFIAPRVRVLEVGSYKGGTLAGYRRMWPDALVVSVDLPDPPDRYIAAHGAHLIERDSHELETLALVGDALGSEGVDLVFIDGDHSYAGVRRDVEMYAPLARVGGLVALHDVTPFNEGKGDPLGPDLLWHEILAGLAGHFEWVLPPSSEGAGFAPFIEIVDVMPDAEGRGPWWGGIGVLERVR